MLLCKGAKVSDSFRMAGGKWQARDLDLYLDLYLLPEGRDLSPENTSCSW
jgi:hypothetical protein